MSKQISEIKKSSQLITDTLREVLLRRNAVWEFLKTKHSSGDTKGMLEDTRAFGAEISEEVVALLNYQKSNPNVAAQVDGLLDKYETINRYLREIQECLNRDLEQKHIEKIDIIKNATFLFGLPFGFVTLAKNGIGHGRISIDDAMYVGFAISIPTVFHKGFRNLFRSAAQGICAAPYVIKNDMRVYYAREIFKENSRAAQLCFATAAKSINDNVAKGVRTMKLGKIFGRRGPQP